MYKRQVSGWASIVISIWGFGGLILIALGMIGEYIGKIYMETKARPRYPQIEITMDAHPETVFPASEMCIRDRLWIGIG